MKSTKALLKEQDSEPSASQLQEEAVSSGINHQHQPDLVRLRNQVSEEQVHLVKQQRLQDLAEALVLLQALGEVQALGSLDNLQQVLGPRLSRLVLQVLEERQQLKD